MSAASQARPVTILVAALGGQGGGVLAEWIVAAATGAGYPVQSTSIPGVAQRTGATTYYVEVFPLKVADLGARRPVLSLLPVPGAIDVLVASELLEAARVASAGLPSPDRTTTIASTSRTLTTTEKMAPGDGRFAPEPLLAALRAQSARLVAFDMDEAARAAGTVVSAVMFGALAASGRLPFGREACEAVIHAGGVGVEASLRGFAAGFDAVVHSRPAADASDAQAAEDDGVAPASARAAEAFPEPARRFVALGHARLVDFQGPRYAALYLERLQAVARAEAAADPRAAHGHALLRETARWLALWMAFDDVVRVAALKARPARFARVRREVGAAEGDVVRIVDHFRPGMPEFAGLVPPAVARRLLAWDERRQQRGKPPFGRPLHVRADGVAGFLALKALAALRPLRPASSRYADEQRAIGRWLDAIVAGAGEDWTLGWEVARCGRLVKGYGETNRRGQRNLAHIVQHVASTPTTPPPERARAVGAAREAALADEAGTALDRLLAERGLTARAPVAQPIRWIPRASAR